MLETKIWILAVFTATGVSLFLGQTEAENIYMHTNIHVHINRYGHTHTNLRNLKLTPILSTPAHPHKILSCSTPLHICMTSLFTVKNVGSQKHIDTCTHLFNSIMHPN